MEPSEIRSSSEKDVLRDTIIVCLILLILNTVAYWQVSKNEFTNYDDDVYVTQNPNVLSGLSSKSIHWAFTSTHASNWHPLTWISHMIDIEMFGLNPGPHHVINLLFHIANSILLFLVFKIMTGALRRSAFVAILFAIHPLHVESVAWIAERKDVLCAFFWLAAMYAYVRYTRKPNTPRYILVLVFFTLGLFSKPMIVTLPFVFLLMDYWPLKRLNIEGKRLSSTEVEDDAEGRDVTENRLNRLLIEKIPFFMLTAASCVITFVAQKKGGAVLTLSAIPMTERIGNALLSYVGYLLKMVFPNDLSCFYPRPVVFPAWKVIGATLFLVLITVLSIKLAKKQRYIITGWLWYLGTLVPVIGLVQVGEQVMSDRYMYLPLVGIFVIISWGIPVIFKNLKNRKTVFGLAAIILVLIFTAMTWKQTSYWKDNISLFQHAIRVDPENYLAQNNLGLTMYERGRYAEAEQYFKNAISVSPKYFRAYNNLGLAFMNQEGKLVDAVKSFSNALKIKPDYIDAHCNMGLALARAGQFDDAIKHLLIALQLDSNNAFIRQSLQKVRMAKEKVATLSKKDEKQQHLKKITAADHNNIGVDLARKGKYKEALTHFNKALTLEPDNVNAMCNKGLVLMNNENQLDEAMNYYKKALKINPEYFEAHFNLGLAFIRRGDRDNAISHFSKALLVAPNNESARNSIKKMIAQLKAGK